MIVVNFSHPLAPHQRADLEVACGRPIERVIDVPVQCDHAEPFGLQATRVVDAARLTPTEWQSLPILVVPPSLAAIAAACLAEIHGRMGCFPAIVRLRPRPDAVPPVFDVAEVIDLQRVREAARSRR